MKSELSVVWLLALCILLAVPQTSGSVLECFFGEGSAGNCSCLAPYQGSQCDILKCSTPFRCPDLPANQACQNSSLACLLNIAPSPASLVLETIVTFEQEINVYTTNVISLPSTTGKTRVNVTLPPVQIDLKQEFLQWFDTVLLSVTNVSTSTVIDAGASLSHIYSNVFDISFVAPDKTSVNFTAPVTMKLFTTDINEDNVGAFCLGFINTTTGRWQCEDSELEIVTEGDSVYVIGRTTHFTSFGVILTGDPNRGSSGDTAMIIGVSVAIPIAVALVVAVIAGAVGFTYYSRRRRINQENAVSFDAASPSTEEL